MQLPVPDATFRRPTEADHCLVLAALDDWWPGGPGTASPERLAALLPRLYFQHFTDASTLVECDGTLLGFLVGFLSQSRPDEGYVHFVGVSPSVRGCGLARHLYRRFFDYCLASHRSVVRAVTSPGNAGSYDFHLRLGFSAEPGDGEFNGRPVQLDYDGPGMDRVSFVRRLD